MAAHRYWRLYLSNSIVNQALKVSEVSMRITPGGANVATGGAPFATGVDGGSSIANAFDGVSATDWVYTPATGQAVIGYDFGAGNEPDIVEVEVEFNSAIGAVGFIPTRVRVEYSDDNIAWTPVSPGYAQTQAFGTYVYGPLVALGALRVSGVRPRVNPGWPNPTAFVKRVKGSPVRNRTQDSGLYRINGTVKVDGSPDTPVARKVVLFDQVSLRPLQDTFSNGTTGDYEFTHLANKPHMVMAFDHTNNFRAVVADRVMPEPMP